MRKEAWFGLSMIALVLGLLFWMMPSPAQMTNGHLGLLMQGIVEIIRCVRCLKDGRWPSREEDVEEVDVDKLKEMMHVKDEDIAKLDEMITAKEGGAR